MTTPQIDKIAPLLAQHVEGARLFANRYEQMVFIRQLLVERDIQAPNILEIGVGFGWFSKFMAQLFKPALFGAVDVFEFHLAEKIWDIVPATLFQKRTHLEYFRDEMATVFDGELIVEQGLSHPALERLPDDTFDVIYVDAGHLYDDVIGDVRISLRKIRPGGYIVFNDYTMMDHLSLTAYGVVKAANELITESDRFKVIGLALDAQMFCDLAVRVD